MDSDNILSILASLGQGQQDPNAPSANVLQAMAPAVNAPEQSAPSPVVAAATAASPPVPKPRRSLLDTVGRIADVFAQVGGATPLYQSTLDARERHGFDVQDHGLKVDESTISNATNKFKLGDLENARVAQLAKGLQAIQAAGGDINRAIPTLGQQMGIDPQKLQAMQAEAARNPAAIDGWAAGGLDPSKATSDRYLGITQVIRNTKTGEIQVLQPSADGSPARNLIPPGWEYVDTFKPVDLGGATGMTGAHSSTPSIILPHSVKPDTVANNATSRANNQATNQTNLTIAGMPARTKAADTGDPYTSYINGVNSIRSLDKSLGDLVGDPRLNEATGLVMGRTNITAGQRAIKGKIDSLVGQGIPAAIAAIKAAGGAAPRSVTEIMGEVKGLVGAIQNRDQATPDYIATVNAARDRLRQRLNELSEGAVRQGFAVRDSNGNVAPAPKAAASPGNSNLPTLSPADAVKLPPGTPFRTLDGRILVRH